MKKFFQIAFKFLLIVSLLLIIGFVTFGLVLWMKWPWWVGAFFLIGYAGLYLGWIFIRKILLRRKEQQFVNQVIEQDEQYIKGLDHVQEDMLDLQRRWKDAIDALKASHLNKLGNPLYVLPWYMVIGESRSGKSTAIQSAELSAPFTEINRTGGIGGTRNCDWWFFEQAVILDTAGRYTIPLEEGRDKQEWQKFLSLLVKYRKKEPLNGLVVTVAADKLLQADRESLVEDARKIRQRIDELMRVLGQVFPVYVLVTKCDLLQGMTSFCDQLPEKSLQQAMGLLNYRSGKDVTAFLQEVGEKTGERLQQLRLQLLEKDRLPGQRQSPEAGLLLFPNEFKNLHNRLTSFVMAAFKENPYQESPVLRGLYFSSGRQEGTPYSHFLHALGLIQQQEVLPGTSRGLFLHDLFARILPQDRSLFAPTQRALAWNRLTRNIGLTAWTAIVLALCGMLSFSFVKNLATLRDGAKHFEQSVALTDDLLADATRVERFQVGISRMEQLNDSWWIPRFSLRESDEVERHLKEKFCRQFNEDFGARLDTLLESSVSGFSSATPDTLIGSFAAHLARRINLIQGRLDGTSLTGLAKLNQPSFQPLFGQEDSHLAEELSERILQQYHHYISWQENRVLLEQEKQRLQRHLTRMLTIPDSNLNWLVSWANKAGISGFDLQSFWNAPLSKKHLATVPPAFTRQGKETIDILLADIESALEDPLLISANQARFNAWYRQAYKQVWYDFATKFPQAEYYLADNEAWQQAAATMASDKSPYFSLLQTMADELSILAKDEDTEDWIILIDSLEKVRLEAEQEAAIEENKSVIAKITKKGKKAVGSIEKKTGLDTGELLARHLAAGKLFNEYEKSLQEITLATSSRAVSFSMAAEIFKEDPATSKSPFYNAKRHLMGLRSELSTSGQEQKMVWGLLAGPLTFLRDYVCLEAACHLNSLWEKDVLVEIQDISDKTKRNDQLFLNNGYAIRFIKGPAAPFLSRSLQKGFYPKVALGRMLPFKKSFLTFLSDGIRLAKAKPNLEFSDDVPLEMQLEADAIFGVQPQKKEEPIPPEPEIMQSYTVAVTANPTSVNREAKVTPHATTLELVCGAETYRLVNLNYPIRKKFVWQPDKCENATLQIEIGSLILKKKYEGKLSFAQFAKEFESGSHVFSIRDFPDQQKQLARMRVKTIKINFNLKGGGTLVAIIDQLEKRKQALAELEKKQKEQAARGDQGIKELLATWERKQKMTALENEAIKKAWKAKQEAQALAVKQAWEAKLPDVPHDITTCWDR